MPAKLSEILKQIANSEGKKIAFPASIQFKVEKGENVIGVIKNPMAKAAFAQIGELRGELKEFIPGEDPMESFVHLLKMGQEEVKVFLTKADEISDTINILNKLFWRLVREEFPDGNIGIRDDWQIVKTPEEEPDVEIHVVRGGSLGRVIAEHLRRH